MYTQWLLLLVFLTQLTASIALSLPGRDVFGNLRYIQGGQLPLRISGTHAEHGGDEISDTVYGVIKNDERFSRLAKAIDFVDGISDLLNDPSARLTFFAPDDKALRRPGHNSDLNAIALSVPSESNLEELASLPHSTIGLSDALLWLEDLEWSIFQGNKPAYDKRKKLLKIIIRAILKYHIVPTGEYDIATLGINTTLPSSLVVPHVLDSQPLRLRLEKKIVPPVTTINFYTKIIHPDMKATNGIIHVVNHPILPPPSVFQELYMVPRIFSTFTSAIQRSNLTDALDLRYKPHEGLKGASLATVFAPINRAFEKLPYKLQLFLFSPFGERVLRKLLQYHVVPDVLVHSDYIHHRHAHNGLENLPACTASAAPVTDHTSTVHDQLPKFPFHDVSEREFDGLDAGSIHLNWRPPHVDPISNISLELGTLFTNHTLHVQIMKNNLTFPFPGPKKPNKIDTKMFVNRRLVVVPDIVALNGAIHVIPRILDPRVCHKPGGHGHPHDQGYEEIDQYDVWKNWDKWLPQWAEEI